MKNDRAILVAFFILFFMSGATGLIYESLWTHYLKMFLGHSSYAQTLVLVLFMGGLAIGSWITSQYRVSRPLVLYALVEAAIGIFALAFHTVFTSVVDITYHNLLPLFQHAAAIEVLKWVIASSLILPAAIALGSTFPLMVTGLIRAFDLPAGKLVSLLYFCNSFGAAVGVLVSGFWLIDELGFPGTMLLAGAINMALAIIVYGLVHAMLPPAAAKTFSARSNAPVMSTLRLLLIVSALTGLASFVYEIAWIRMLSLVLGSSNHAFEMMLSAFVFGLALGGFWIRDRISQLSDPLMFLGKLQVIMGLTALLSMFVYEQSFYWMQWTINALSKNDAGYTAFNVFSHGIALLVMLPTTICAGMTLPIITNELIHSTQGESAVGKVYAANTFGAIVGVLVSVQLLMPLIGLQNLLTFGAAVDISLGVFLFYQRRWIHTKYVSALAVLFGVLIYSQVDFALERLASGVYRDGNLLQKINSVFHKDGKTATVDVFDIGDIRTISTNGKSDASVALTGKISVDEHTMVLLGAIPLLLNPDAVDAAVIGMGSGITSHTLLASSNIQRLDTVEIEPAMIEGARFFGASSARVFEDARSNIVIDDAKTFFIRNRTKYDLIVSEPSNPWVSGVASVFSLEFYGRIREHLKPDGLFVQWLHLYESNESLVFSVLNALSANFDHFEIYTSVSGDMIIVAKEGAPVPELMPNRMWTEPALIEDLRRINVKTIDDLRVRHIASREHILLLSQVYPAVNTDFFPYLDLGATRARFKRESALRLLALQTTPFPVTELVSGKLPVTSARQITDTRDSQNLLIDRALRGKALAGNLTGIPIGAEISRGDQQLVHNLLSIGFDCSRRVNIKLWERALMASVDDLLSLPPSELQVVWSTLSVQVCDDEQSSTALKWIRLLKKLSDNDLDAIIDFSNQLLVDRPPGSTASRFLTLSKAVAMSQMGRHQDVLKLLHETGLMAGDADLVIQLLWYHSIDRLDEDK